VQWVRQVHKAPNSHAALLHVPHRRSRQRH